MPGFVAKFHTWHSPEITQKGVQVQQGAGEPRGKNDAHWPYGRKSMWEVRIAKKTSRKWAGRETLSDVHVAQWAVGRRGRPAGEGAI